MAFLSKWVKTSWTCSNRWTYMMYCSADVPFPRVLMCFFSPLLFARPRDLIHYASHATGMPYISR